jgi:hypothetical protein
VATALTNDWPYDVIVQVANCREIQTSGDGWGREGKLVIWMMKNLHAVSTGNVWGQ